LNLVFKRLDLFGIKLNARRCNLLSRQVHWCGRIVSKTGVRFDPELMDSLKNMADPANAGDLQQFVCAMGWLRAAIIHVLQEAKNRAAQLTGSSNRKAMNKIQLSAIGWDEAHRESFQNAKEIVERAVELAHPDPEKTLCLFSDASDLHWAIMLTQIPEGDLAVKETNRQRHEPLVFLSGTFKGSSLKWATIEKEAFPIVEVTGRLRHFLLREKGFLIFTDHRNLTYILDSAARATETRRHVCDRLERWSTKLLAYKYTICHITGSDNVWADLLTRWAQPHKGRAAAITVDDDVGKKTRSSSDVNWRIRPLHADGFVWPTLDEIVEKQQTAILLADVDANGDANLNGVKLKTDNDNILKTEDKKIWVPSHDLALRIMVVSHSGSAGHRGVDATMITIKSSFWFPKLTQDVQRFVKDCLHCELNKGAVIPRPWGTALHADAPNKLITTFCLWIGSRQRVLTVTATS